MEKESYHFKWLPKVHKRYSKNLKVFAEWVIMEVITYDENRAVNI